MATQPKSRAGSSKPAGPANKALKVVALQEHGRHRAGRFWPQEPVTVALSELTDKDVELIQGDPKLHAVEVDIEPPAAA